MNIINSTVIELTPSDVTEIIKHFFRTIPNPLTKDDSSYDIDSVQFNIKADHDYESGDSYCLDGIRCFGKKRG